MVQILKIKKKAGNKPMAENKTDREVKTEKRRVGFRYHIWADIFNRVKYSFLSDDIKPVEYLSSAKINYELQHCGRRNDTGGF